MDTPAIRFFRQFPQTVSVMETVCEVKNGGIIPPQRIEQFLQNTPAIDQITKALCQLNLFEALGVGEQEIRHSRLLKWLLTPDGSHGCGTIYLKRFLEAVLKENGESLVDLGALDLAGFQATCEDDRIDVLLVNKKAKFVCAIENKIHSKQSKGQLERYRKKLEALYHGYQLRFAFLTLSEEKPDDCEWISSRYSTVLRAMLGNDTRAVAKEEVLGLLFRSYAEWIQAESATDGTNLFNILNLNSHELRHSDFLAWLLDPRGTHGLGERFLHHLLGLIRRSGLSTLPADAESMNWSDLEVRRELENIDVLLFSERHRIAIVIENKVRARERKGQMADYRDFVQRHFAQDHLVLVFLDMQGRPSSEGNVVNLSYADFLPFFTGEIKELCPFTVGASMVLLKEYRRFLETKLWTRKGVQAPPQVEEWVRQIKEKMPTEFASFLVEIREWKKNLCAALGTWLLEEAKELFGSAYSVNFKRHWFLFTPHEYDAIPQLRNGGADPAPEFDKRLVNYYIFVVPFGSAASRRPPQLSLGVGLLKASPSGKELSSYLHRMAKGTKPFNRARGDEPGKHTGLLIYRLISNEDVALLSVPELKIKLKRHLERFYRSIHPELVTFFREKVKEFEPLFHEQSA